MPELPEVEVIRNSLRVVVGKAMASFYFSSLAPIQTTSAKAIRRTLLGRRIAGLDRRGKYLLLMVEGGARLVLHLGMSGKLLYFKHRRERTKHTHMEIFFSDGSRLSLIDPRRFGTISLSFRQDGADNLFLQKLGLEYDDPNAADRDYIARFRSHPGLALKTALLNQGIVAGLGNIYACEALYRARLDPRRKVKEVSDGELLRLFEAIRKTLDIGIRRRGTTLRDYVDGHATRGQMQNFLKVYGRRGRGVVRIVQQNRATWFCPQVQR